MSHENTPLNAVLEIDLVDKGELGHIYPHTVVYHVGRYSYLLAEDERGDYLIKPIFSNGTLGPDIVNKKFRHYYDVIQAAYDDLTATTYICAASLAGKSMEIFTTTNGGLQSKVRFNYQIDDRKTFNFFFIEGNLYFYESGEDANGKYTVKSIRVTVE
ncbi:TPA: hypothetical protein R4229_003123 [Morganella morganii]|nr:hypothetical protein [Morganella morganii]